jgi:hypothetical protein
MSDPIVVNRAEWGAKYSPGRVEMPAPVAEVNIHHSVTRASRHDPCRDMRQIERILHGRGLDPGYSACIHPTGVILIGAGDKIGAHTAGRNSKSYGICFIGDFTRDHPTWDALQSAGWLINLLRFTGKLVPQLGDITIQPHSATKATACPGENLRNRIEAIRYFAGLPEVPK